MAGSDKSDKAGKAAQAAQLANAALPMVKSARKALGLPAITAKNVLGAFGVGANKKDKERQAAIEGFAARLQDADPANDAAAQAGLEGAASSWAGGGKAMAQKALDSLAGGGGGDPLNPPILPGALPGGNRPGISIGGGKSRISIGGQGGVSVGGGKSRVSIGSGTGETGGGDEPGPDASAWIRNKLGQLPFVPTAGAPATGGAPGGQPGGPSFLERTGDFIKDNFGAAAGAGVAALGVKESMEADKLREQALGGIPEDSQLGLESPDDSRYRSLSGRTDAALAGLGGGVDERLTQAEQGADRYRSLMGPTDVQGRASAADVASQLPTGGVTSRLNAARVSGDLGPTDVAGRASAADVQSQLPTGGVTGRLNAGRVSGDLGSTDVAGRINAARVSGDLGSTDVAGRLDPRAVAARTSDLTVDAGGAIAPEDSDRLGRYRSLTDAAQGNLGGPDRTTLAKQTLADLEASTARERGAGIRDIGQAAAKFGRLGSGMVTTDLGNLESVLQERSGQRANELAAAVAEGDIGDRYRTLDATRSGESTIAGEEAARRGELRGERANVQDVETGNVNRGMRAAEFGTGVDQANEAARLAAAEANINVETGNVNRGLTARQFGVGVEEGNAARDLAAQQANIGIETGNVGRGLTARQFGVGVEEGNVARDMAAQQANLGIETGNVDRAYDAGMANTGLAERNAGRRTAAEDANLDIETGNVNRRIGARQFGAGVEEGNAARDLAAQSGNIGIETGNVDRAYDAGVANTGLAERNAGRRSAAEDANLGIETGNVNRRLGVGASALGYGANVADAGIDDRYRTLGATAGVEGQAYDEMAGDRTFNQTQANSAFSRGMSRGAMRGNFAGARDARAENLINAGADLANSSANRNAYEKATGTEDEDDDTDISGWIRNKLGQLPFVPTAKTPGAPAPSLPAVGGLPPVATGGVPPIATPPISPNLAVQPGAGVPSPSGSGRFRSLMRPMDANDGPPSIKPAGLPAPTPGVMPGIPQAATPHVQPGADGVSFGGPDSRFRTLLNPQVPQVQPMVPQQAQLPPVGAPAMPQQPQGFDPIPQIPDEDDPADPRFRPLRRKPVMAGAY